MREDAFGRLDVGDRGGELRIAQHQFGWDDPVVQNLAPAIDVEQEGVDRVDPLFQPTRQMVPFGGAEHARQDVERDDPLGRLLLAVHREGDADLAKGGFGGVLAAAKLVGRGRGDPVDQSGKFRPRSAVRAVDLIERPASLHEPFRIATARLPGNGATHK